MAGAELRAATLRWKVGAVSKFIRAQPTPSKLKFLVFVRTQAVFPHPGHATFVKRPSHAHSQATEMHKVWEDLLILSGS